MNEVLLLQIIFILVTFVLMLVSVLLPLRLMPSRQQIHQQLGSRPYQILSLCNCVACGVFLATCFMQLVPYVELMFHGLLVGHGISHRDTILITQGTIFAGFFLVLAVEQLVHSCRSGKQRHGHSHMLTVDPDKPSDGTSPEDPQATNNMNLRNNTEKSPDQPTNSGTSSSTFPMQNFAGGYSTLNLEDESSDITDSDDSDIDVQVDLERRVLRKKSKRKAGTKGPGNNDDVILHQALGEMQCGHSHFSEVLVQDSFNIRCVLLMLSLSLHSLLEGMTVGLQEDLLQLVSLFVAVILHECLVSFALGVSLASQKIRRATLIKLCVLYCSMIPLGMIIGLAMGGLHGFAGQLSSAILQGITAGTFIYVVFLEILPTELANLATSSNSKMACLFVGFFVVGCLTFALPHHDHK